MKEFIIPIDEINTEIKKVVDIMVILPLNWYGLIESIDYVEQSGHIFLHKKSANYLIKAAIKDRNMGEFFPRSITKNLQGLVTGINLIDYKKPGVYCIDNLYIGRSINIGNRIQDHLKHSIGYIHQSKLLQAHILMSILSGIQINVKVLSQNPLDEAKYINEYRQLNQRLLNIATPSLR